MTLRPLAVVIGIILLIAACDALVVPGYESPVMVGSTVNLTVAVYDANGTLEAGVPLKLTTSMGTHSGFGPGINKSENVTTESDGKAYTTFFVGDAGDNYISISGHAPDPSLLINIEGAATGVPATIKPIVSPDWVYADGDPAHVFIISYKAYDAYGYAAGFREIAITSNLGESVTITTNYKGDGAIAYGPKVVAANYTLTARAVDNVSASVTSEVMFVSGAATDMYLTANPQTVSSKDLNPSVSAQVNARTLDIRGNPVKNEAVKFRIVNVVAPGQVSPPTMDGAAVGIEVAKTTDAGGNAQVTFVPGSFIPLGMPGWNQSAKGSAIIQANWDGITRFITMRWENYPFVSVNIVADPLAVSANGTVDITIRLLGDGYALQPKPIDVVLDTDRSGSMASDTPTRLSQVKSASKTFVAQLDYAKDEAGLVSFGSTSVVNRGLVNTPSLINSSIDGLTASGYTAMRDSIYKAVGEIKTNGRTGTVKAIVLLSDGDYNYFGDPLARGNPGQTCTLSCTHTKCKVDGSTCWGSSCPYTNGQCITMGTAPGNNAIYQTNLNPDYYPYAGLGTGPFSQQNLSVYAKANGIAIYTIAFTTEVTQGGKDTLRYLSEQTGGQYYEAPSASDLVGIYAQISGALKTEAGIGTQMNVKMNNVVINNQTVSGATAFDYVHEDDISTRIHSWNLTGDVIPQYTIDQTGEWAQNRSLMFNIGTIKLGQTWEGVYRLKVKAVGLINIFGSGSEITFADGSSIILPDTYINCIDWSGTGSMANVSLLDLHDLHTTGDTQGIGTRVNIQWNLTYIGHGTVTNLMHVALASAPNKWIDAGEVTVTPGGKETAWTSEVIITAPKGKTVDYILRVESFGSDGGYDMEQIPVSVRTPEYVIKLG